MYHHHHLHPHSHRPLLKANSVAAAPPSPQSTWALSVSPPASATAAAATVGTLQRTRSHGLDAPNGVGRRAASTAEAPPPPPAAPARLGFRYNWSVRVQMRQLSPSEAIILQISPKFATVHEHVSFSWTLKMHGTANPDADDDDDDEEEETEDGNGDAAKDEPEAAPEIAKDEASSGEAQQTKRLFEKQETHIDDDGAKEAESTNNTSRGGRRRRSKDYVAISLYYVDGPVSTVELKAKVKIIGEKTVANGVASSITAAAAVNRDAILGEEEEGNTIVVARGRESEVARSSDRDALSAGIKRQLGRVVRLSLLLEMDPALFRTDAYLNAVSPTPIYSFLTANYRARVSSKVWKRRTRQSVDKRPRSASDGLGAASARNKDRKLDLERIFNKVMESEREAREARMLQQQQQYDALETPPVAEATAVAHTTDATATIAAALLPTLPPVWSARRASLVAAAAAASERFAAAVVSPTPPPPPPSSPPLIRLIGDSTTAGEETAAAAAAVEQSGDDLAPPATTFIYDGANADGLASPPASPKPYDVALFKKLLVACCESCERRASLIVPPAASLLLGSDNGSFNDDFNAGSPPATINTDVEEDGEKAAKSCGGSCCSSSSSSSSSSDGEDDDDEAADNEEGDADDERQPQQHFECPEKTKAEMHDMLANMFFNKVALPGMEYVEDFADFLVDAELNELPVLKRACERYLCDELHTKRGLMTSLLLELLFLSMVFQLPIMRSMTLSELTERYRLELEDVERLLKQDEYINLDKRIRQLCDRNLYDLIDEVKRFREQKLRVQVVPL